MLLLEDKMAFATQVGRRIVH